MVARLHVRKEVAMQALVWEGPRQMNMRDVPDPTPAPDEVLIKVAYSGICGSELGGYLGHNSLRKPPLIMGHEFAGEIVALGRTAPSTVNPRLAIGQRVTVNPLVHNPWSKAALKGRQNLNRERKIIGIHRPGSYAQLVTAPATNTYPIPDSLSLEHAALAEPLPVPSAPPNSPGQRPPTVSSLPVSAPLDCWRCKSSNRQAFAPSSPPTPIVTAATIGGHFGVTVLDPRATNVAEAVRQATDGEGVDMAIDAVGATATRRECIESVTWGGKVIFTGLHDEESNIQANYIIRSEVNIQGSFAYTTLDFEDALNWLSRWSPRN